ncbi:MAG TPA: VOC family protein [Gemmatimonadota bacterium]|nr:VOC family protein [Gemmatimonadota bacterium]
MTDMPHFELDHVFVAVPLGTRVFDELRDAGFTVSDEQPHKGQGTASRGLFFENAYAELIWLADPSDAGSDPVRRTRLLERTDPTRTANPFGLCIRANEPGARPPFETWEYRPAYMPAGLFIPVALNSERLDEPLLFFLSWRQGPPPVTPDHDNGTRVITRVALEFPANGAPSPELEAFARLGLAQIDLGADPLLRVELDGGRRGNNVDLRPHVPLAIRW